MNGDNPFYEVLLAMMAMEWFSNNSEKIIARKASRKPRGKVVSLQEYKEYKESVE